MPILMLSGVSQYGRLQITDEIVTAIGKSDGWIVDHTLFSNIALTIRFAIPENKLATLSEILKTIKVSIDDASMAALHNSLTHSDCKDREIYVSINVTFIHSDPDVRREIPAVPG